MNKWKIGLKLCVVFFQKFSVNLNISFAHDTVTNLSNLK